MEPSAHAQAVCPQRQHQSFDVGECVQHHATHGVYDGPVCVAVCHLPHERAYPQPYPPHQPPEAARGGGVQPTLWRDVGHEQSHQRPHRPIPAARPHPIPRRHTLYGVQRRHREHTEADTHRLCATAFLPQRRPLPLGHQDLPAVYHVTLPEMLEEKYT